MAKYNVWNGDGGTRPFNSIETAGRYAYASMKRFMDKWRNEELETRVIFTPNEPRASMYFGRIHYRRSEFSYFYDGRVMRKLCADGSLTTLTPNEKAIIKKVENNPKNW